MLENDSQTSEISKNINDKLSTAGSLPGLAFGLFFLGFLLVLPSGIVAWFDGLPWTGETETLVISVVIPFLLILGWRFLSLRLSITFLVLLLILKIALFLGSPSSGWLVKVHPNLTQEKPAKFYSFKMTEGDTWVKTYATIWNEKASGVLKNSWTEQLDFPLDWAFTLIQKCGTSGAKCFNELSSVIEIDGALLIPEGEKFALIAQGVQEGTLLATNENGESFVLLPAKNRKEATLQHYQFLQSGRWVISGKLHYKGKDWSLIPTLVNSSGAMTSDLGREVLWQNEEELSSALEYIGFYKVLSFILDGGVILFLLAWAARAALSLANKQILNLPLALFSVLAIFSPIILAPFFAKLLNILHSPDLTTVSYLGFSIVAVGIGFVLWAQWKKDFRSFQVDRIISSVVILFGPAVLIFFTKRWWSIVGQWSVWGSGDDWTTYQVFARKIMVEGQWLNAGEGVFMLQPLYRYFVGIYHWLFGQSAFVQHMADVWCVLGATIIIAAFAMKFRISPLIVFISSITYLAINLISAFRYHFGRGLVENHAMIFMMLAAWFLYRSRERGGYRLILATVFGIFGYWMRQDHLGAIAGIAFLILEPVDGPTGGWKGYWDRFKLRWDRLTLYWAGGILSILALCFRHWWLGEAFFVTSLNHPNYGMPKGNYYLILTGNEWPIFPSISGFVVTIGVFVGLLVLFWRPKPLLNFPFGLGITLVGLLAPYAFLWVGGYPPRFSIHVLPIAILSLAFLLSNVLKRYEFPFKEYWFSNKN